MEKVDQTLLDHIQYIYVAGQLPDELRAVYEKLPKKQDGTLNMERKNKVCYTFVEQATSNKKFNEIHARLFGTLSRATPSQTKEAAGISKLEESKEKETGHRTLQPSEPDVLELIEHMEKLLAKTVSLLDQLKTRVNYSK